MADIRKSVEKFAQDLAAKVENFVEDISELEVRTFTTPENQIESLVDGPLNLDSPDVKAKIQLRAYSQISFDGDTTICVPESEGVIDKSIWNLHQTMVSYAMQNRATMLKTIGDAAAAAINALNRAGE
jgi:hypothetical protein